MHVSFKIQDNKNSCFIWLHLDKKDNTVKVVIESLNDTVQTLYLYIKINIILPVLLNQKYDNVLKDRKVITQIAMPIPIPIPISFCLPKSKLSNEDN